MELAVAPCSVVSIAGLERKDVVLALANMRAPASAWSDALFSEHDLERSLAYWQRWQLIKDATIFDTGFLSVMQIPVAFIFNSENEDSIVVSKFNALHGEGAAELAIANLRESGSFDTRHLRERMKAKALEVTSLPESENATSAAEAGLFYFHGLSTHEALCLLWSLIHVRKSQKPYTLSELVPSEPSSAWVSELRVARQLGAMDELPLEVIRSAISEELGVGVMTINDDKIIRILDRDVSLEAEFALLGTDYAERKLRRHRFYLYGVGTCLNVASKAPLLGWLLSFELPIVESIIIPIGGIWALTLAAPIGLLLMLKQKKKKCMA